MSEDSLTLLLPDHSAGPRVTPLGRRLALTNGLALTTITGSGPGGRVTRRDVERHLAAVASAGSLAVHGSGAQAMPIDTRLTTRPSEVVPPSEAAPTAWLLTEVDLTALLARRLPLGEPWRQPDGVAPALLAAILTAVIATLRQNPLFNAAWPGTAIRLRPSITLAVIDLGAVRARLPHVEIHPAASLERLLVDQALAGPPEATATFTLHLGGPTPGIAQPALSVGQTACLVLSDPVRRPTVVGDAIALRSIATLGLVFDHRVVDGAPAGAFLRTLKKHLEEA